MSQSKEHLRSLMKEAIPDSSLGIVNFRALREVLAATIDHSMADYDNGSNINEAQEHDSGEINEINDDSSNMNVAQEHDSGEINEQPKPSNSPSNEEIKSIDMMKLNGKLDEICHRFGEFSSNLLNKMEILSNKVSLLEKSCISKK